MNWNQFLTEFVLRASTNEFIENYTLDQVIELARRSWDAIQAAELPESEKAKVDKNSYDLKLWAKKAIEYLGEKAEWIAIDSDGSVWAYDIQPIYIPMNGYWSNAYDNGNGTVVGAVDYVEDWTNELYEISKILNNEL